MPSGVEREGLSFRSLHSLAPLQEEPGTTSLSSARGEGGPDEAGMLAVKFRSNSKED